MKKVTIYTDGSCKGNGKVENVGGWCAVLGFTDTKGLLTQKTVTGHEANTTNNRMELLAVIGGLAALKESCVVEIHTDSKYVKDGITVYLAKWQANGWRTSKKQAVKNQDLWVKLLAEITRHTLTWAWIKGHSGNLKHDQADAFASAAIPASL